MHRSSTLFLLLLFGLSAAFSQTPQHPVESLVLGAGIPDSSHQNSLPVPPLGAPPRDVALSVKAPGVNAESDSYEEIVFEKPVSDYALGILSIVGGVAMLPLGLLVTIGNSWDKCEERDENILSGGVGPCSRSGPSEGGQIFGAGISVGGVVLIGTGLHILGREGNRVDARR